MEKLSILPILKKIPLFAELSEKDHQEVIDRITMEYFPAHHRLMTEGEPGGCLYIIKNGRVKIFKKENSQEKEIAVLGENDFLGEISLISNKPRMASAETIQTCELFKLEKEDFEKLLSSNQNIANIISKEFLNRMKENKKNNIG